MSSLMIDLRTNVFASKYPAPWCVALLVGLFSMPLPALAVGGNTCATATVIGGLPYTDTGNTSGFSNSYDEICPNASSASDVVYVYSPSIDECVDISLCTNTFFDTKLYVYANDSGGCPLATSGPSGNQIACEDDNCSGIPNLVSEILNLPMLVGVTYWIVVDGTNDAVGNYEINISAVPLRSCPISCVLNSECDDADTCTDDICVEGVCQNPSNGTCCTSNADCDDGNDCTMDVCNAGLCQYLPVAIGTFCTDDGDPCTDDLCDGTGTCVHSSNGFCSACCTQSLCQDGVLQTDCAQQGGFWVGGGVTCASNPCGTGACCLDPCGCEDNGGSGISETDCVNLHAGTYVGGALCSDAPCHTWCVDWDGAPGNGCTTWPDACPSLSTALGLAQPGDRICVAQGAYPPDTTGLGDPRTATFALVDNGELLCGFTGMFNANPNLRDPHNYISRLTGEIGAAGPSDNVYHVVTSAGSGPDTLLDGCWVADGHANGSGTDNRAAGMFIDASSVTVWDCTFSANVSSGNAGAMIITNGSAPAIVETTFATNGAGGLGGAVRVFNSGPANFFNCRFLRNQTNGSGGAVSSHNSTVTLVNSIFSQNKALGGKGGALYATGSTLLDLWNCTLSRNTATDTGGGMHLINSLAALYNDILWENSDVNGTLESSQISLGTGGSAAAFSTCIENLSSWAGNNNIGIDPDLRDPANDDLELLPTSPCIDAGDNGKVHDDSVDLDGDGDTIELTPIDLAGRNRFIDAVNATNTGVGTPPFVDMGAYEMPTAYLGTRVVAVGNAVINVIATRSAAGEVLVVSNIGSSGEDGVDIASENNAGIGIAWEDPEAMGDWPEGAFLEARFSGKFVGLPEQDLGSSRVSKTASGGAQIEIADLLVLLASFDIRVYDEQGNEVAQLISILLPSLAMPDLPTGVELSSALDADFQIARRGLVWEWASPQLISISEAGVGLVEVTGVRVEISNDAMLNIEMVSHIEVLMAEVPELRIIRQQIERFGFMHEIMGEGVFSDAMPGYLTIAGIGVNQSGVSIALRRRPPAALGRAVATAPPVEASATWDPLDAASTPDGAYLEVSWEDNLAAQIGTSRVTDVVVGYEVSVDLAPIGAATVTAEVYDGETLVASAQGLSATIAQVDAWPTGTEARTGSDWTQAWRFPAGTQFELLTAGSNRSPAGGMRAVAGDRLAIIAESPTAVPAGIDSLSIQGVQLTSLSLSSESAAPSPISPPLPAPYPHDRRKNRYISFDPDKGDNDGSSIAFKVELLSINMGSCDDGTGAEVDFCRGDRGAADCKGCSTSGDSCISASIDCSPGESCVPTGATCVNDLPSSGGSNVALVWWVGPEKDTATDPNLSIHLLVSEPFRKVSDNWPNPTHAGDCEVVPQASYGVRAVEAAGGAQSDELVVETTQFPAGSPPAPFWWGDVVGVLAFHCNADIREQTCDPNTSDGDCTGPGSPAACCTGVGTGLCDCTGGDPCARAWELPNGVTNVDDVTAALWTSAPAPPTTVSADFTWADMHGNDSFTPGSQNFDPPNNKISASDLQQIGSAFGGLPYKFYDPADCPDTGVWP